MLKELKKALKDGVELINSNRNLRSEMSRIRSQLEAEKGENRMGKILHFKNTSSGNSEKLSSMSL